MDLSPDKCGESSEMEGKKLCTDCKTGKTPLWRSGPHGPKSLCNACGIRFRKFNKGGAAVMTVNKKSFDKDKDSPSPVSTTTSTTTTAAIDCGGEKGNDGNNTESRGKDSNLGSKLKVRLMCLLGRQVVLLKRPRSPIKRKKSTGMKLGEVEQAALLLMTMSSDPVFA